jgi:hypothetical protein
MAAAHGDFIIYYTGAQILLDGKGRDLYDLNVQKVYQARFNVAFRSHPLPYNHPPYELLLFAPLTLFPYAFAFVIWGFANLVLLVTTIWLLSPLVKAENRILCALIWGAFFPVTAALWHGQDSILSVFLISSVIVNLKRGRDHVAGMILALGLYKPQLVLPIALFLAARGHWASILAFTATGTCLILISIQMIGREGAAQYVSLLHWMNNVRYTIDPAKMVNLRGMFESLMNMGLARGLVDLITLLSSAAILFWSISFGKSNAAVDGSTSDLCIAQLVIVTVLVSYHLYVHDLTLLTISLVILFNRAAGTGHDLRSVIAAPLVVLIAVSMPVVEILLPKRLLSWAALSLVALLFVLSRELRQARSVGEKLSTPPQPFATL